MVAVAQLDRAPDCGSGGRGFEPPQPPISDKGRRRFLRRPFLLLRGVPARRRSTSGRQLLEVTGRTLMVPQAARSVARFDFSDLCEKPLGPGDFLKIAKTFHTVIVENIPKLSKARRNEAKRFVILIDALYDNHVRLIASAAVAPAKIYPEGDHAFEFNRTASRLVEMQSEEYLMAPQNH